MWLGFPDRRVERAFQLHYGWPACVVGLGAAVMGLLVHGVLTLRALLLPDASPFTTAQIWHTAVSMATAANFLIMYAVLGKERFVLVRGIHSVWHRLLFATGVLFCSRPSDCAAVGYCRLLWQHRLLFVHVVGTLGRSPFWLYWFGGIVSWLAAVAVDVVDPGVTCESIVCVLAALQAQAAADPKLLLHKILSTSLRSSRVFAVDVVLPGLLLTWLELRARRAWWQQQQARQQEELLQLRREAAAHKKEQQAAAAPAAALAAAGSSISTALPAPPHKPQQQQQPNTATSKPPPYVGASSQTLMEAAAAAAAAAVAAAQSPAAALQPAAAPAGSGHMQAGAALSLPVGAAQPAQGLFTAVAGQRRNSVLYSSPVQRCIVSLKFSKAPGRGSQGNAVFQQQVAAAVQAAVQAASDAAPRAAQGAALAPQQIAVMVTGVAAFPGCYQLVMHLVLPKGQVVASQLLQLQQQIQQAAQGVLEGYPADCSLMSAQLQPLLSELDSANEVPTAAAAAAAAAAGPAAGAESAAPAACTARIVSAADDVYMHPVAVALPDSSSSSSSKAQVVAAAAAATVNMCIAQPTVAQLVRAGHSSVRVVVTSQLPGAPLIDNTWQLPSAEAALEDVCLPLQLQFSNYEDTQDCSFLQQPLVLSVVVLAGSVPDSAVRGTHAAAAPAGVSAAGAFDSSGSSSEHPHAAVTAKLPLLLLPTGAAAELQQLHTGMTAEGGLQRAAAYQEVLPLLQDLAVVLCSAPVQHSSSAVASRQHMMFDALVTALLACFERQGLASCMQLLQGKSGAGVAAAAPLPANLQRSEEQQGTNAATTLPALGGAAAISEAVSAQQHSMGSGDTSMPGQIASFTSHGSGSSGSSSDKCSSFSHSNTVISSKLTGSSSYNTTSGSQEAEAESRTGQQQVARHLAIDGSGLAVWFRTLVFGFPADVEVAYAAYKSEALRTSDFLSMLSYGAGLVACGIKLVCAVAFGNAVQVRVTVLRAGFLITHVITHTLLWAASTGAGRRLVALQQWRNTVLAGGVTLALCMFAGAALCEGVWGTAGFKALRGDKITAYWVFMVYRHMVQPTRLRIGLLHSLLLAAEFLAVDVVFVRPQLLWLGPNATALLVVVVQLSLTAGLELSLRRSFVCSL